MIKQEALAVGGEFGILEGRTFALIHPIVMGGLFFYTLWAGYLGWQWRRVRTTQNEINELKKQVKPTPVTPDGTPVETAPSPVNLKIQQLTEVGALVNNVNLPFIPNYRGKIRTNYLILYLGFKSKSPVLIGCHFALQ